MQTGHPGIEACTYSCPKIKKGGDKTIYRNNTFRLLHMIISNRQIDKTFKENTSVVQ